MRIVKLTHGIAGKPFPIDIDEVWACYKSDKGYTILVAKSGGVLPVKETEEEIVKLKETEGENK